MSFISAIRPQAIEDAQENASWYGGCASARRFYAYVGNDPLDATDPLGLWTLQAGVSFYLGGGPLWVGGQISVGIVADGHGNGGFYGTVGGGPTAGAGLKLGIGGSVSGAPTINDLQGPGAGASVVVGAGFAGSLDWSKGRANDGTTYNNYGASVGLGGGAAVSAGPSVTGVVCQVGPDCGSFTPSTPANNTPPASNNGAAQSPTAPANPLTGPGK